MPALAYQTIRLVQHSKFEQLVQAAFDRPDYEFDHDHDAAQFAEDPRPFLAHLNAIGGGSLLLKNDGSLRTRDEYRDHYIAFCQRYSPVRTGAPLAPLAQRLFEQGLVEAGEYIIEVSW